MFCSERRGVSSVCLCLFLLSLLVALAACQRGGRLVNCKKMVFAPICRGAGAKRAGKILYPNELQQTYSPRNTNQFMSPEKQLLPYWFYTAKKYQ